MTLTPPDCKLHRLARAFIFSDPAFPHAMRWLLSDDPDARQCGGCNPAHDPGACNIDRIAIHWASARRWESLYHRPHRPFPADTLREDLERAVKEEG